MVSDVELVKSDLSLGTLLPGEEAKRAIGS